MREARPSWLLRAALLAGAAAVPIAGRTCRARRLVARAPRMRARSAAHVRDANREPRRPAHRRLHDAAQLRPPARQAARRRLCAARPRLSRPRRHSARHRRPQPARSSSRPISRPPIRTAAMPGTRAAITARPWPTTTPRSGSIPTSASPYVNRATRAARSRLHRRRAGGLRQRRSASVRTTPAPIAAAASSICASSDTARAIADFDQALRLVAERRRITCCGRRRARKPAISTSALADYREASRLDPKTHLGHDRRGRHLAQEGRPRQGDRGL